MKRYLALMLCFLLSFTLIPPVRVTAQEDTAKDISDARLVVASEGFPSVPSVFDKKTQRWLENRRGGVPDPGP